MILWRGNFLSGTLKFPQPKWLSLKQADFPSACWLKEPLIQTEATLSLHAKCVSEAQEQAGLCERQPFLTAPGTCRGLPSHSLTAMPRWPWSSCWEIATTSAGSLPPWVHCRKNMLCMAKGWSWLPEASAGALYDCFFPIVSISCTGLTLGLGGPQWTWVTSPSNLC